MKKITRRDLRKTAGKKKRATRQKMKGKQRRAKKRRRIKEERSIPLRMTKEMIDLQMALIQASLIMVITKDIVKSELTFCFFTVNTLLFLLFLVLAKFNIGFY